MPIFDHGAIIQAPKKINAHSSIDLTVRKGEPGRPRADLHEVLSGIVYWLRSAPAWRDLPHCYGAWQTVYSYWRLLNADGIISRIHAKVAKPKGRLRLIDATFLKVHQHAANGRGTPEEQGIGRSKGGPTTKLHALVDEYGTLVAVVLTPGNVNDCTAAPLLLDGVAYKRILADKAYDTDYLRQLIRDGHSQACIPSKGNRKKPYEYDKELYKLRHIVENVFQRLKVFRSIDTRYQKILDLVEGATLFGSLLIQLGYRAGDR